MAQLLVTVNKLNKRNAIPAALDDKSSVVDVVVKGTIIEAEKVTTPLNPALGDWYKGNDGFYYWGGGLSADSPKQNLFGDSLPTLINWNNSIINLQNKYKDSLGTGVKIGVLDFGITMDHPDLSQQITPNQDFTDPNVNSIDDEINGHGTHVAGIIAASSPYTKGVIGVAPKSKLYIAKVLGNNASKPGGEQIFDGIHWLQKEFDPHIYNLSLGFIDTPSENIKKVLDTFLNSNRFLVAAAGDDGDLLPTDIDGRPQQIQMPASHQACIKVGTISKSFINNIDKVVGRVDIICPRIHYWSCSNNLNGNKYYKQLKGSSMAAAFISGIIALILSSKIKNNEDISKLNKASILEELKTMSSAIEDINFDDETKFYYTVN